MKYGCIKGGCCIQCFPFCLPPRAGSSLVRSDSSAFLPAEIFLTRRFTDRAPIGLHESEREEAFPASRRPAVGVSRSEDEEESACWCVSVCVCVSVCACSCSSSGYLMQPRTKQPPVMFQPVFSLVAAEPSSLAPETTTTHGVFQNKSRQASCAS